MQTVVQHILLWTAIFVIYTIMLAHYGNYHLLILNLINIPLFMMAYYLLKYVQIPYLYDQGNILGFVLSILISSFVICAICRINGILWMDDFLGKDYDIPFLSWSAYVVKTVRFYTPAMAILAWESHQARRKEKDRIQALEKEKMANELKFLKAQINPHFLFNTLNNLYSYVLCQSPKAPDMIMRLSGILDYVLYKSQNKTVPIEEEINTIENFLGLEQIRYGERLEVDYQSEVSPSLPISPLILLSIVENAFKHGASGDIDNPKIKIDIKEQAGDIHCEVWNTKSRHNGELNDAYKEGIGLSNIKRQLNLIYPNKHQLRIDDQQKAFNVSLTISPLA